MKALEIRFQGGGAVPLVHPLDPPLFRFPADPSVTFRKTHCVKSVQIRSCSGPCFAAFGLNMARKNSVVGHFSGSANSQLNHCAFTIAANINLMIMKSLFSQIMCMLRVLLRHFRISIFTKSFEFLENNFFPEFQSVLSSKFRMIF